MSVLGLLGMARKAGRLIYGMDSVENSLPRVKLIVTACDAGKSVTRNVAFITENKEILVLSIPHTAAELGHAIGVSLCAVAGVTDAGLSAAICAQRFSDDYKLATDKGTYTN